MRDQEPPIDGKERRFGGWYHVPANVGHAAEFAVATSEVEFWFETLND
jgi:hypothetical protein